MLLAYAPTGELVLQDRSNIDKIPKLEIGYWGSGLEDGENSEAALIRELKEELDLDISKGDLFFLVNTMTFFKII